MRIPTRPARRAANRRRERDLPAADPGWRCLIRTAGRRAETTRIKNGNLGPVRSACGIKSTFANLHATESAAAQAGNLPPPACRWSPDLIKVHRWSDESGSHPSECWADQDADEDKARQAQQIRWLPIGSHRI